MVKQFPLNSRTRLTPPADSYGRETRQLFVDRVVIVFWLAIILFLFFSVLDFILYKQVFLRFLSWRITFSLFLLGCLVLLKHYDSYYFSKYLCFACCLFGDAIITAMIVNMGACGQGYYMGIVLMMIGLAGILPLSTKDSLIAGIFLYAVYAFVLLFHNLKSVNIYPMFFNNSFFFISFIMVSSVLSYENSKRRFREFMVRQNIAALAGELSRYSNGLKKEVDKRMIKIEESEIRYQELYNHIHDLLVLIDKQGIIMMANSFFCRQLGLIPEDVPGSFFFNYVCRETQDTVKSQLFHRLCQNGVIKGSEFHLARTDGQCLDVECNGKVMAEEAGYQLVIRDVTIRKKMEEALKHSQEQVGQARVATILGLAKLAEYRDEDTGDHLERMREYSRILAMELAEWPEYQDHITENYIEDIYLSSILHDIGKVGIPDDVLLKPGPLNEKEYDIMKNHSRFGGDALSAVEKQTEGRSFLTLGKEIAYYHHEKWDGTGYPAGLKNGRIPLSATIVALADVYDALTSKRCYKPAFSHDKAKKIIIEGRGTHFAPDIVDAFLAREELFKRTRKEVLIN